MSIQLPRAAWSLTRADGSILGTLPHGFQEAEGSGLHLPLISMVSNVLGMGVVFQVVYSFQTRKEVLVEIECRNLYHFILASGI